MINCIPDIYPKLHMALEEANTMNILISNSPMKYAYSTTFPNGRTVIGAVDYGDSGMISIGQTGSCNYESVVKRLLPGLKMNLQT